VERRIGTAHRNSAPERREQNSKRQRIMAPKRASLRWRFLLCSRSSDAPLS